MADLTAVLARAHWEGLAQMPGRVEKHGDHDQKSHGNWATGGSAKAGLEDAILRVHDAKTPEPVGGPEEPLSQATIDYHTYEYMRYLNNMYANASAEQMAVLTGDRSAKSMDRWRAEAKAEANGEPGSVFIGPRHDGSGDGVANGVAYYRGPTGEPIGFMDWNGGQIYNVGIAPGYRGQGYGTKFYDTIQDTTDLNLYEMIGMSDSFTVQGKAFAEAWLEHRIEVESEKASKAEISPLHEAQAALDLVREAVISPDGVPSPEEEPLDTDVIEAHTEKVTNEEEPA